jgi:hypothetical protein
MFRETVTHFQYQTYVGIVLGKVPKGTGFFLSISVCIPPALSTHAFFIFSQQLTQSLKKKSNIRCFKTQKCTLWAKENFWILSKVTQLPLLSEGLSVSKHNRIIPCA